MNQNKEQGFSIIEMLVALVILGVALTSILPVFINYANINRRTAIRAEAISVAEQVMDGLRQRNFSDWKAFSKSVQDNGIQIVTGEEGNDGDNGRTYIPTVEWCKPNVFDLCKGDNAAEDDQQRHVRVTVSLNGQAQYSVTTVYVQ